MKPDRGTPSRAPSGIIDIAGLSPYNGKRWMIKGRIVTKSDVRTFNSARGPGQLFKIDITDGPGSEIAATFFGAAVDQFFDFLKLHQVYTFAGGSVKAGNPKWDRTPNVITFDQGANIQAVEDDSNIPGLAYNFRTVAQIMEGPKDITVDLRGLISEVRPCTQITMRDGRARPKRSLLIWDPSMGQGGSGHIEFTVWGQQAEKDDFPSEGPIFIKGARVGEFNNTKSLNSVANTVVAYERPPAVEPAWVEEILAAWSNAGKPAPPRGATARSATIQELHNENMRLSSPMENGGGGFDQNAGPTALRHALVGTVTTVFTERPPYYPACSQMVDDGKGKQRACNKKLVDEGVECWRCASGHTCQRPQYRYLLRARLADHTGMVEVSSFDEAGRLLFGCEANDLAALWDDENRNEELQLVLKRPYWKRCSFSVRSQKEVWQDEERVKVSVIDIASENMVRDGKKKIAEILQALSESSAGGA